MYDVVVLLHAVGIGNSWEGALCAPFISFTQGFQLELAVDRAHVRGFSSAAAVVVDDAPAARRLALLLETARPTKCGGQTLQHGAVVTGASCVRYAWALVGDHREQIKTSARQQTSRIFTACCAFVASIRAVWPPYRGAQRLEICPHIPSALGCHWHGRAPAHWAASHGRSELAPAGRQRDRGFSFGGAPVHQQGRRGWPREVDRVVCRAVAAHIRLA